MSDPSLTNDSTRHSRTQKLIGTCILAGSFFSSSAALADESFQTNTETETRIAQCMDEGLRYFDEAQHSSGLVYDRMSNASDAPAKSTNPEATSLAATGYGLAVLPLMVERNIITREEALSRFKKTLDTIDILTAKEQGGWLYHFVNPETLEPSMNSEVSSIDTALFYYGALISAEYFEGAERDRVYHMLDSLDFELMLDKGNSQQFSHGYYRNVDTNAIEFIPARWDHYSEGILLAFLALSQNKVGEEVWSKGIDHTERWSNGSDSTFGNLPLFTYYYPLGFIPCKDAQDSRGIDYWIESATAVSLQKEYCELKEYPEYLFGISACDGPDGYHAYAAHEGFKHKVIAPPAILASLPYAEEDAKNALKVLDRLELLNGRYGMVAAFDVESGWQAPDMLGIDIGSTLLMLDQYQNNTIQKLLQKSPYIQRSLTRAGFREKTTSN